jgi:diacylglycerol kinase family enzyme
MYYYIANPISGHNRLQMLQTRLRGKLKALGIEGSWNQTTAPGEVQAAASEAARNGFNTIIAIGGDDTFSEAINGTIGYDDVAIGVIPIGDNNRLASRLGILDWQQACNALAARRITSYSLIAAGQQYFLSALELGFETELDKKVDGGATGVKNRVLQTAGSLNHARNYKTIDFTIDVDQSYSLKGALFSLSVTNQRFINHQIDNKLIVEIGDHPGQQLKVGKYLLGVVRNHHDTISTSSVTTRVFANHILLDTQPQTSIMVDGKLAGRTPIAIKLTDKQTRIITAKPKSGLKSVSN